MLRISEPSRGLSLDLEPLPYDKDVSDFGAWMRDRLAKRGLSLREFARLVKKSNGNISNIINSVPVSGSAYGAPHRPPLEEMDAWADALGCTPDERDHLKYLAERTHCPPGILAKLDALEAEVASYRAQVTEIRSQFALMQKGKKL